MKPRVLTLGHSTHPIEEFVELVRRAGITLVVDVRTLAGSRHNPQFNEENLSPSLEASGIAYLREKRLGGLRKASRAVDPQLNGLWRNPSFHRYADYALGPDFAEGLDHLIGLATLPGRDGGRFLVPGGTGDGSLSRDGEPSPVSVPGVPAIMCSEAVWWRCHRRIIADYLLVNDVPVAHLMPDGRLETATLTAGAHPQDDRTVTYPSQPELPGA